MSGEALQRIRASIGEKRRRHLNPVEDAIDFLLACGQDVVADNLAEAVEGMQNRIRQLLDERTESEKK